jgi:hypothetical protein
MARPTYAPMGGSMQLPDDLPPYLHTIALYLDGRGHRRIDILECLLCVHSHGTARSCEYLTVLERETVDALIDRHLGGGGDVRRSHVVYYTLIPPSP